MDVGALGWAQNQGDEEAGSRITLLWTARGPRIAGLCLAHCGERVYLAVDTIGASRVKARIGPIFGRKRVVVCFVVIDGFELEGPDGLARRFPVDVLCAITAVLQSADLADDDFTFLADFPGAWPSGEELVAQLPDLYPGFVPGGGDGLGEAAILDGTARELQADGGVTPRHS